MFSFERDLVQAFKNVAEDFLQFSFGRSISQYFLVEEFDSHCGIADLVMGTYLPFEDNALSRRTINWNWVRPILDEGQDIEINEFISTYGISRTTAFVRLKEYAEAGFLEERCKGRYRVLRKYRPVTETIVSIEAKLRNWQRALHQAIRYKRFSNKSYVLLDEEYVKPALKSIHLFQEKNIGLMSMDHNSYTIHYKPKANGTSETHAFLRLNEAVVDYFNKQLAYS